MTRPVHMLLVLPTLVAACCAGCAQLPRRSDLPDDPGERAFRPPRSQAVFTTSADEQPALEAPPAKKPKAPAEVADKKPPVKSSDLPSPPPWAQATKYPTPPGTTPPELPPSAKKLPAGSPPALEPPPAAPAAEPVNQPTPPNLAIGPAPIDKAPSEEPLLTAMRRVLEDRRKEALEPLKKYDAATQELFLRLLPAMALMTQKKLQELGPQEVSSLHEQLTSLSGLLRPRTELVIDRVCFCEWAKSFGNFQPLPEGHVFVASEPNRPGEYVQLYAEVKNFASENRDGLFETRFASAVEIQDSKGEKIWFHRFEDRLAPIRSRTLLHDYFNNYRFFVPHLPPGTYTLTIVIADETIPDARREARKSLEFRVGPALR